MTRWTQLMGALALASCAAQGSVDDTASTGSKWSSATVSPGTYTLVRAGSGKCLDGGGGAALSQMSCQGGSNQLFRVESVSGGIRLVNPATGKCVDVSSS